MTAKRKGIAVFTTLAVLAALAGFCATNNYPSWWLSGVVNTNWPVNDFAPAIQGQLKWIATNAADELEEHLPGGAGTGVNARLSAFTLSNNYFGVNIGQLKYVGEPFWVRLIEEGYTDACPWTVTTADDADFAPANIGQLKNVFSFDVAYDGDADDLPDWWETHYFGGLTNEASGDWDADGLSNLGEYQASTCPTNSDSDGDTIADGWEVDYGLDPLVGGSAGVVAWYKLDETDGTIAADSSTNSFHGSITGTTAAAWQWGAINRCLELDGTNDGVKVADALALRIRSNITLAGWVNLRTTNGIQTVTEKTSSYYLNIKDGKPQFFWYGITNTVYHKAPQPLLTGVWTHVAATYNGQAVIIYVDGVAVLVTNAIGPGAMSSQPLGVGWNPSTKDRYLGGCLDDVRVYGSPLTSNQVHGLYEVGADFDEDGAGNLREYEQGSCPTNPDTDGDGALDGFDPQPTNGAVWRLFLSISSPADGAVLGGYE